MTEQTETPVDIDLDSFENELLGAKQEDNKEEEKVVENEDDSLANDDEDDNEEAEEQEDEDEESDEPEEKPKRRNRAQERIEKLVAEARQAERERDALRIELERLRVETKEAVAPNKENEAPAIRAALPADAPNPDTKDKDGNPIYELGEFDPKFIRDLTRFTIEEETKAMKERQQQEETKNMIEAARHEIQTKWNSNLETYEAEVPEVRENITKLVDTFSKLEPNYGEYLASIIMDSDFGPQLMDYFSQNIGEAQKVVASGPAAATRAIGRLEAKFVTSTNNEDEKRNKKVSDAPPPPPKTKGTAAAKTIRPDTPNLDDFEKIFYQ